MSVRTVDFELADRRVAFNLTRVHDVLSVHTVDLELADRRVAFDLTRVLSLVLWLSILDAKQADTLSSRDLKLARRVLQQTNKQRRFR